ncbi:iron complex transport system permease protein [Pedobacter steynii]|uniref:Iron complex transport system permease protein n=1 Tax=Pedobacter steynii TaxID=430522 RepID=A0A1H0GED8_9SPHI|nr:iron ABC transporter permease [Pedobacter steynii]SDO05218.1 iron complex transport system permease protein [Pedobacter steynii]
MIKNTGYILLILTVVLVLTMVISSCVGAVQISFSELISIIAYHTGLSEHQNFEAQQAAVFLNLRLPRVLLGVLIGAALGVSGAAIQGLFRNPLAEPGLIGISSGATLFAVIMIVLETKIFKELTGVIGFYALSLASFIGAGLTTMLVYRIAMRNGKTIITTLLLGGIAINALAGAFIGLLTYMATDAQLRNITFWSLGSLGGASWPTVTTLLPFVLIPVFGLPFLAKSLNALALGESQAMHMGVNVKVVKRIIIAMATMAVGASVAVAGMIAFIGLIIPHILRMTFTADHRLVVPGAALLGAALLTMADLIARTVVAPAELPIGILTAMIGAPVFIYIIITERNKNNP